MIEEPCPMISTTTNQRMVSLDRAQRRRLLVHALGWIGLGRILASFCCTSGPLAIDWLIPSPAGLLVAVVSGIIIGHTAIIPLSQQERST